MFLYPTHYTVSYGSVTLWHIRIVVKSQPDFNGLAKYRQEFYYSPMKNEWIQDRSERTPLVPIPQEEIEKFGNDFFGLSKELENQLRNKAINPHTYTAG
jgi:hypothetical protein